MDVEQLPLTFKQDIKNSMEISSGFRYLVIESDSVEEWIDNVDKIIRDIKLELLVFCDKTDECYHCKSDYILHISSKQSGRCYHEISTDCQIINKLEFNEKNFIILECNAIFQVFMMIDVLRKNYSTGDFELKYMEYIDNILLLSCNNNQIEKHNSACMKVSSGFRYFVIDHENLEWARNDYIFIRLFKPSQVLYIGSGLHFIHFGQDINENKRLIRKLKIKYITIFKCEELSQAFEIINILENNYNTFSSKQASYLKYVDDDILILKC